LIAAFPGTPGGNGSIVNLYSHFLGYAFGYIVPYVTLLAAPRIEELAA